MSRAELKQQAKDSLKGKWGTAVAIVLVYSLIISAISLASAFIPGLGAVASIIIVIPLEYGFIGQMMKFSRGEEVGICDFFKIGFDNFGKSWSIYGNKLLKLIVPIIMYVITTVFMVGVIVAAIANSSVETFIVGALISAVLFLITYIFLIVKSYLYVIAEYIGNDSTDLDGKGVIEKSEKMMNGHRWEYFVLQLSFIGWAILAAFTFGIGMLFLEPYMQVTTIKFYENLPKED